MMWVLSLRSAGLILLLFLWLFFSIPQARGETLDQLIRQCVNDPAYRVGGAAHGDCLAEQAEKQSALALHGLGRLSRDLCPAVKTRLQASHENWLQHRESYCEVFPAIFDNTVSYVNQQACRLRLTLDYRESIAWSARYLPSSRTPCD